MYWCTTIVTMVCNSSYNGVSWCTKYSVKDSHGQKIYSVATSSSLASHWKCQVPQNTFSSFLVFHAVWKCPQKSRFLKISHLFMKLTLNFNFARIQKFIKMRHFSTTVYLLLCQLFQRGKKRENRSIWPNTWLCYYILLTKCNS